MREWANCNCIYNISAPLSRAVQGRIKYDKRHSKRTTTFKGISVQFTKKALKTTDMDILGAYSPSRFGYGNGRYRINRKRSYDFIFDLRFGYVDAETF